MPTVLRRGGFNVRIYFNDHAPPHVHVIHQSGEARIGLVPVELFTLYGLTRRESAKAKQLVAENREYLLHKWIEIHGQTNITT